MKSRIFFLLLVIGVAISFWPGAGKKWVEVNVNEGQSTREIAAALKDTGLIHSSVPLRLWIRLRRAGSRLQIGRYRSRRAARLIGSWTI